MPFTVLPRAKMAHNNQPFWAILLERSNEFWEPTLLDIWAFLATLSHIVDRCNCATLSLLELVEARWRGLVCECNVCERERDTKVGREIRMGIEEKVSVC